MLAKGDNRKRGKQNEHGPTRSWHDFAPANETLYGFKKSTRSVHRRPVRVKEQLRRDLEMCSVLRRSIDGFPPIDSTGLGLTAAALAVVGVLLLRW
jgi:hypothetical protein